MYTGTYRAFVLYPIRVVGRTCRTKDKRIQSRPSSSVFRLVCICTPICTRSRIAYVIYWYNFRASQRHLSASIDSLSPLWLSASHWLHWCHSACMRLRLEAIQLTPQSLELFGHWFRFFLLLIILSLSPHFTSVYNRAALRECPSLRDLWSQVKILILVKLAYFDHYIHTKWIEMKSRTIWIIWNLDTPFRDWYYYQ